MKSIHTKLPSKIVEENIKFPVLAEYVNTNFVVLFEDYQKGTVVWTSLSSQRTLGEINDRWVQVTDKMCWRILDKDETIVLSND